MAHKESRRNGKHATHTPGKPLILAVSACICLAGISTLVWAVDNAPDERASLSGPNPAGQQVTVDEITTEETPVLDIPSKKDTRIVHHTAYSRIPIYRIIFHRKAVTKTVVAGGRTHVTLVLCPACGRRHARDYTEKVLDHYEEHPCKACGGKHAKAYDERVEGE